MGAMQPFVVRILLVALLALSAVALSRQDVLDMRRGAIVLVHPGQHDKEWPAMGMIDGTTAIGWASTKRKPFPHHLVIELARTYAIDTLVVDNRNADEADYPLLSAKKVIFLGSTQSPDSGYRYLGTIEAKRGGRSELRLSEHLPVRWLRVEIHSNHGNPRFTELMELEAYGEPLGPQPPQPALDGDFVTNWEMLRLRREGDRLVGCYDLDAGYLRGSTDGRVLDFRWVEHGGSEKGEALLVLSSGGHFLNGLWYESGVLSGVWFGNRDLSGPGAKCDIDASARRLGGFLGDDSSDN